MTVRVPELGYDTRSFAPDESQGLAANFLTDRPWSDVAQALGATCALCLSTRTEKQRVLCAAEASLKPKDRATQLARISCAATIRNGGKPMIHQIVELTEPLMVAQ